MPGFDGTGPGGMGPMTGGGRGFCNPYTAPYAGGYAPGWGGYGCPAAYYQPPMYPAAYQPPAYPYGYGYGYPAYAGGYPAYGGWYPRYGGFGYPYPRYGLGRGPCGGGMAWGRRAGRGAWW